MRSLRWRKALLCLLLSGLLCAAAGTALLFHWGIWKMPIPKGDALPVLMYHHIVEDGQECNSMTVTVSRMEKDLRWLRDNGYTPILPRELAAGEELPENPVLITFDDGYTSNYELLYPLLQKYDMKAVISIITCMQEIPASNFISWDMCREMTDSGLVEIGSHTNHLHNLGELKGNLSPDGINGIRRRPEETDADFQTRVLDDIQLSYDLIEEHVGAAPTFFAYPFGATEPDAEALINSLFPVTADSKGDVADLRKGLHFLPRITVTMDKELDTILKSK